MDQVDHTVVQDPQAQSAARELSLQAASPESEVAPELPGYVLQRRLGRGSFGEVWAATQSGSGQAVAVKIFSQPRGVDFRYLQHEIKRLRQVAEHPHVVTLLDADFHHDPPFFVMALYQKSLSVWRQEQDRVDLKQAEQWLEQIAQALKFTHDKGLLHCDLKPANVLLDAEQRVKVADFGQAVERGLPGSAVGSLGYMAPEQASLEDSSPDVRWDIYGLGATMYYLLTGRPPRLSDQSRETMGSITDPTERLQRYRQVIADSELIPIKQLYPQIDEDLEQLLTSCLSLDPARRPQSVSDLMDDLARRREKRPLLCRRPWTPWYRAGRFARRNAIGLGLVAVVLASAGAGASEYYLRAEEQRRAMALQQFDMGWQVAREGRTTEAALWWRKSLDTDDSLLPARAALDSVSLKLAGELAQGDEAVTTVAASPDGDWLAGADAAGTLRVWQKGRLIATISGLQPAPEDAYTQAPAQIAFTPRGMLLTTVGLFAPGETSPRVAFSGQVTVDPAGQGALLVGPEGSRLFDARTEQMTALGDSPRPAAAMALAAEPRSFAVLGSDGKVDLYYRGARVAQGLHDKVGGVAFSPDGRLLVTCSEDRTARLWNAHTGAQRQALNHGWRVTSARFSEDGEELFTTCYNGDVRVWDVASGVAVMHSPMRHSWFAYGTVGHAQGDLFASHGVDGRARVWRPSGLPFSPWYLHGAAIRDVAFLEADKQMATAGQDGKIRLWHLGEERKGITTVDLGERCEITSLALDPRGELFAVAWTEFPDGGGAVLAQSDRRWPLATGGRPASEVLFSPDGSRLALASADGRARVFDRQGKLMLEVAHGSPVVALGFTPDSQTLLSAEQDGTIKLSRAGGELSLRTDGELSDARFSDNGKLVAACTLAGQALVWETGSGQQVGAFEHPAALRRLVFDSSGRRLLLCGQDGVARLLDLEGHRSFHFEHDLMVTAGAFDQSGHRLATASLDGSVKVWDTVSGAQLPSPSGHAGPVTVVGFSPDGRLLLTVSKDSTAQLWESSSGLPFGLPVRHQRIAYDGAFTKDGKQFVTAGHDGAVKFTDVPLQEGAVIPSTPELESLVGSRLADREGKTVCESVDRVPVESNDLAKKS